MAKDCFCKKASSAKMPHSDSPGTIYAVYLPQQFMSGYYKEKALGPSTCAVLRWPTLHG